MVEIFGTFLADDDLLWVVSNIQWDTPTTKSVEDLIISPSQFIRDVGILVKNSSGATVEPTVPDRYSIEFIKDLSNPIVMPLSVQGISNSSRLCVKGQLFASSVFAPKHIPNSSRIQITLVPKRGYAFIHWQISSYNPSHYTTHDEIKHHLKTTLFSEYELLFDYSSRLALDSTTGNYLVRYVDEFGNVMAAPFGQTIQRIDYAPNRRVELEGEHDPSLPIQPDSRVISCNADIGMYYIDPATNQIVIVIDNTTIKLY